MLKYIFIAIALSTVAGCVASPRNPEVAYMNDAMHYRSLPCNELLSEQARLASAYNVAVQQYGKRSIDVADVTSVVTPGWSKSGERFGDINSRRNTPDFTRGTVYSKREPAASISGNNFSHEALRLKDEQKAISETLQSKKCPKNNHMKY